MTDNAITTLEIPQHEAKHLQVARVLGQRIRHGDYLLQEFPAHRDLAKDAGVSEVTARRAVKHLVDEGLLVRQANGRPAVRRYTDEDGENSKATLRIALLTVAYPSPVIERWHRVIAPLVKKRGWVMRMVGYSHQSDPIIEQTLESFDGVFFSPGSGCTAPAHADHLKNSPNPVVVLNRNWTSYGVPCLWMAAPAEIQKLLNHLADHGHQRIACLNTQPKNTSITEKIEQWQLWTAVHGESKDASELIDKPVKPFEPAARQAYHVMRDRLEAGPFDATALYCVTSDAARGALKAFKESGIEVGKDIAVCAADDDGGKADLWETSLTCIQEPDPKPYLDVCLDWMSRRGRKWLGPLLVQPPSAPLFIGESTKAINIKAK